MVSEAFEQFPLCTCTPAQTRALCPSCQVVATFVHWLGSYHQTEVTIRSKDQPSGMMRLDLAHPQDQDILIRFWRGKTSGKRW